MKLFASVNISISKKKKKERSGACGVQQDETSPALSCGADESKGGSSFVWGSRHRAWQETQLIALWSLSSWGKAEMWAPTARHTGFSRSSAQFVCSSSMVPLSCLKTHFCRSRKSRSAGVISKVNLVLWIETVMTQNHPYRPPFLGNRIWICSGCYQTFGI